MTRAFQYFLDEALASLWRGYRTALMATLTIAAAIFVLGGFLIVTSNAARLFTRWQEAAEFSVYLRDDFTPAQRDAIERALRGNALVSGVETISKDEALQRFRRNFTELATAVQDLPENPLPASMEVRLRANASPGDVEKLATDTARLGGVSDVRYDRRWIQRLLTGAQVIRVVGLVLAGVLILAAGLTVASVVRLALLARRDEIHIMQLVGAPLAYIRGPFVLEGLIQGGAGALVATVVLWLTFLIVRGRTTSMAAGVVDLSSLSFLSWPMWLLLMGGGMTVGSIGGLVAARSAREMAD